MEPIQFSSIRHLIFAFSLQLPMDGNNENWVKEFIKHCLLFQSKSKVDFIYGLLMWLILIVFLNALKDLISFA